LRKRAAYSASNAEETTLGMIELTISTAPLSVRSPLVVLR
jgi:hypothetical protein